jgi:hypothetical protein
MNWAAFFKQSKDQVSTTVKGWSLANYLFNLAVSSIPPLVFGWLFKMPWYLALTIGILCLIAMVCGMILFQSATTARLHRTVRLIRDLAERINISGLTVMPTRTIGPKRDLIAEAAIELSVMVKPDVVAKYEECLQKADKNVAAKLFLTRLADTLTAADLRGAA